MKAKPQVILAVLLLVLLAASSVQAATVCDQCGGAMPLNPNDWAVSAPYGVHTPEGDFEFDKPECMADWMCEHSNGALIRANEPSITLRLLKQKMSAFMEKMITEALK
jgi:hypothetical protein